MRTARGVCTLTCCGVETTEVQGCFYVVDCGAGCWGVVFSALLLFEMDCNHDVCKVGRMLHLRAVLVPHTFMPGKPPYKTRCFNSTPKASLVSQTLPIRLSPQGSSTTPPSFSFSHSPSLK